MPELPEVETVRRGLEPVLVGHVLTQVELRRLDLRFPFPDRFEQRLVGQKVEAIGRRAKYLLAHLSSGETLVMHLGMSGRFTIVDPPKTSDLCSRRGKRQPGSFVFGQDSREQDSGEQEDGSGKHDHVLIQTSSGHQIIYNDARRFGFMLLIGTGDLENHRLLRKLGPEPLGNALDAAYLAKVAQGRKTDLKAFLMDQRMIAGLGNIYVCEALYRAGLRPDRAAGSLCSKAGKPLRRAEALLAAIRSVLHEAIAAGGSSLRDYQKTDGTLGYFQHGFAVYGREGLACPKKSCTGTILRQTHAGRSTFYCPHCQK